MIPDLENGDKDYIDNLSREVYFDAVSGWVRIEEIPAIIAGAQDYLKLRRKILHKCHLFRVRVADWFNRLRYWKKRGILMIDGQRIKVADIIASFAAQDYICDENIADAIYLSLLLQKPLLIEGEPGVGKTEIAKVMAAMLDTQLIRLQCYEGLDENKALYEWNYQKQLLFIQGKERDVTDVFVEEFLFTRPLLKAILAEGKAPVLLIDEIDKADEEFEAFLLEMLSDFQVSIPEFGTIKAKTIPHIVITNNDTRELTHALKRRCVFLYIDYPTIEKEQDILIKKVPGIQPGLAREIAQLMHSMRERAELIKKPSIAEGIDMARALVMEGIDKLNDETVDRFLPTIIKNKEDLALFRQKGKNRWLGVI